ncbi:DEDDh family exonuclease [Kutzneria viridogrisea]|uniref:DNA polymerase-3 subunit epsilon n=1 Tax=Kutzneria viridogrisea TaxID=47990 RepID=A0ABR6BR83_9PSEU|nr:DNA polymerase-3 subunit epsilon [Kutzneria viridogrisea]
MSDGYAVVDVETTGFAASGRDRVIEVAVVQVDRSGEVTSEWCTLVNPGRDLGPQHIHRITAADARRAPAFHRVAGTLAAQLAGRVVVAHNLSFDARFLAAEFNRLGVPVPVAAELGLCTMELGGRYLPERTGRSLRASCDAAGVRIVDAHSALYDAHAAAGLLSHYLRMAGRPEPWRDLLDSARGWRWPVLPAELAEQVRRRRAAEQWSPPTDLPSLRVGDLVVFTGQTEAPRQDLVDRALAHGLRVNAGYVTRQTRLLVAADPDSMSVKANTARRYGVPIVSEAVFGDLLT